MKVTDKCCLFVCDFGVVVVVVVIVVLRVKTGTRTVTYRLPFVQNSCNFFLEARHSFEDI